ncbi:inositol polyphosphate 1-phosphatase [Daktulosphaira vitifoliae]|uniref:inositol polyphosphate 1-phosphatase n=1 Tax=Daktulosphaira vitifoliae TaxID=58002 RepID=UPI0021AAABFA|nr:inositol polyphosphate 1-phosphatase [Daktulosphaira vitifoliae]
MSDVSQSLIQCALLVSETAADIARQCRSNTKLLSLLVQEKSGDDANRGRFAHDFKTLADVLVQRVVAKRIGRQFTELANNVFGEENDKIQNNCGNDVTIKIGDSMDETFQCLLEALDDDMESARSLAVAAHKKYTLAQLNVKTLPPEKECLNLKEIGVWIDPIDSTNEYIVGTACTENEYGICSKGLQCVTINIGMFDKKTGRPVAGVINQPFHELLSNGKWSGHCYWAICSEQYKLNSLPTNIKENTPKVVLTSSNEEEAVTKILQQSGYTVVTASGAGYKLLCTALGLVSGYVLTKNTTFLWDTCAAHAMLLSLGGDVCHCVCPASLKSLSYGPKIQSSNQTYCNSRGIIASHEIEIIQRIHTLLNG